MSGATILLSDFPPELLSAIVQNLSKREMTRLIRTCSIMHDVVARILYRDVTAVGTSGRRYFRTIGGVNSKLGRLTRKLSFIGAANSDIYSMFSLFSAALSRLEYLSTLNITIPPARASHLLHAISSWQSSRANAVADANRNNLGGLDDFRLELPCLRVFTFHGDCKLSSFATGNSIAVLFSSVSMSFKHLEFLISRLTDTAATNSCLQELHLRLDGSAGIAISDSLNVLGRALTNLRRLSIVTPRGDALEASRALTTSPPLFPCLAAFRLNDWAYGGIDQPWISKKDSLEVQRQHIVEAGTLRDTLDTLAFGTVHWTKDRLDVWTVEEKWVPYLLPGMTSALASSPLVRMMCFYDRLQREECDQQHTYRIYNRSSILITKLEYHPLSAFDEMCATGEDSNDEVGREPASGGSQTTICTICNGE